jgi:hypothetical protein
LTEQEGLVVQDLDSVRQDLVGSIEPFESIRFASECLKADPNIVAGVGVGWGQDVSAPAVVKCRLEAPQPA